MTLFHLIVTAVQLALPSLTLADIKIEICDETGLSAVLTNQGELVVL